MSRRTEVCAPTKAPASVWGCIWEYMMEYAVNYTPQAADLLAQHRITFDRFKCPAWPDLIAEAQKIYPVYVHFPLRIGMGIGDALDTERNQPADWGKVERLLQQTGTPFVNVHLAPIVSDFPDIASDSDDPADMDRLIEAAQRDLASVIRRFGADKVIAENDYYYPGVYFCAATLPRYIRSVIESGNCGMLLDISHARLAARLLDRDAKDYLAALPLERIREIHLTGIQHFDQRWQEQMRQKGMPPDAIDHFADRWIDHVPMTEDDWAFYGWTFDQLRSGAWHKPWVASLEYGGVGAVWQTMTDSAVLADQVPRLKKLLHDL